MRKSFDLHQLKLINDKIPKAAGGGRNAAVLHIWI